MNRSVSRVRIALASRPRFAAAHDNLGWALAEKGNAAAARE